MTSTMTVDSVYPPPTRHNPSATPTSLSETSVEDWQPVADGVDVVAILEADVKKRRRSRGPERPVNQGLIRVHLTVPRASIILRSTLPQERRHAPGLR